MGRVFKTEVIGNFTDRSAGTRQEVLGFFDEFQTDIFLGRLTGIFLEHIRKVIGR